MFLTRARRALVRPCCGTSEFTKRVFVYRARKCGCLGYGPGQSPGPRQSSLICVCGTAGRSPALQPRHSEVPLPGRQACPGTSSPATSDLLYRAWKPGPGGPLCGGGAWIPASRDTLAAPFSWAEPKGAPLFSFSRA